MNLLTHSALNPNRTAVQLVPFNVHVKETSENIVSVYPQTKQHKSVDKSLDNSVGLRLVQQQVVPNQVYTLQFTVQLEQTDRLTLLIDGLNSDWTIRKQLHNDNKSSSCLNVYFDFLVPSSAWGNTTANSSKQTCYVINVHLLFDSPTSPKASWILNLNQLTMRLNSRMETMQLRQRPTNGPLTSFPANHSIIHCTFGRNVYIVMQSSNQLINALSLQHHLSYNHGLLAQIVQHSQDSPRNNSSMRCLFRLPTDPYAWIQCSQQIESLIMHDVDQFIDDAQANTRSCGPWVLLVKNALDDIKEEEEQNGQACTTSSWIQVKGQDRIEDQDCCLIYLQQFQSRFTRSYLQSIKRRHSRLTADLGYQLVDRSMAQTSHINNTVSILLQLDDSQTAKMQLDLTLLNLLEQSYIHWTLMVIVSCLNVDERSLEVDAWIQLIQHWLPEKSNGPIIQVCTRDQQDNIGLCVRWNPLNEWSLADRLASQLKPLILDNYMSSLCASHKIQQDTSRTVQYEQDEFICNNNEYKMNNSNSKSSYRFDHVCMRCPTGFTFDQMIDQIAQACSGSTELNNSPNNNPFLYRIPEPLVFVD